MSLLKNPTFLVCILVFIVTFTIYFSTMPNINTGYADSDEMITAAKIWGVVHPPGYPLYTVFNGVMGRLPIETLTFAGRVNLGSVFLHSFSAVFVFLAIFLISNKFTHKYLFRLLLSLIGLGSLIVSPSFWLYGTISEVFSLNNFLITLSILIFVFWYTKQMQNAEFKIQNSKLKSKENTHFLIKSWWKIKLSFTDKLLLLGAFVLGLGISNQQAVLLVYPAFVALVLMTNWKVLFNWKLILISLVLFFVGFLAPYIYLPIAASGQPVLNWENVHDINSLYRVITRRVFAEASPVQAAYLEPRFNISYIPLGMTNFYNFLRQEFSIYILGLSLSGLFYLLYRKAWILTIFIFLGILGGGLFFANFSAFASSPDENYYLPHLGIYQRFMLISPIFMTFLIAFGVLGIVTLIDIFVQSFYPKFKYSANSLAIVIALICLIFPIMAFLQNYTELKNNNYAAANIYARALLTSLPKDAVLLCFTEHSCFSGTYLQQVEGLRADIVIVQVGFAQMPIDQFKKSYPGLIQTVTPKATLNHAVLIIRDIIRSNIDKRPIFVAGINNNPSVLSAHGLLGDPFFLVPQGCAMKIEKNFIVRDFPPQCNALNEQLSNAYYSAKHPIAQKFPAYLAYQHYLNAYQYVNNKCPKRGAEELLQALRLNPRLKAARDGYLSIVTSGDKDTCIRTTEGPRIADLLVSAKEAEALDTDDGLINALYAMDQVVSLEPGNIEYRLKLADLYMKSRAYNNALYEYSDILEHDPKNVEATKQVEYILNHNL